MPMLRRSSTEYYSNAFAAISYALGSCACQTTNNQRIPGESTPPLGDSDNHQRHAEELPNQSCPYRDAYRHLEPSQWRVGSAYRHDIELLSLSDRPPEQQRGLYRLLSANYQWR